MVFRDSGNPQRALTDVAYFCIKFLNGESGKSSQTQNQIITTKKKCSKILKILFETQTGYLKPRETVREHRITLLKPVSVPRLFIGNFDFFSFFENFSKNVFFSLFFPIDLRKIFFGVEKKSWVQFRCKKLRPFDLWCFQRVLSTLIPSSKGLHYFFRLHFFFDSRCHWPSVFHLLTYSETLSFKPFSNLSRIL